MQKILLASTLLALTIVPAQAHSGRTNAQGCHTNHKTGEYHCHNSGTNTLSNSQQTQAPIGSALTHGVCPRKSQSKYCPTKAEVLSYKAPIKSITPGFANPSIGKSQICSHIERPRVDRQSKKIQNLFLQYGISTSEQSNYTIDHLIPVELGGSSDVANLWPQRTTPDSHVKDKLENRLKDDICTGAISVQEAQQSYVSDWRQTYIKYFLP